MSISMFRAQSCLTTFSGAQAESGWGSEPVEKALVAFPPKMRLLYLPALRPHPLDYRRKHGFSLRILRLNC